MILLWYYYHLVDITMLINIVYRWASILLHDVLKSERAREMSLLTIIISHSDVIKSFRRTQHGVLGYFPGLFIDMMREFRGFVRPTYCPITKCNRNAHSVIYIYIYNYVPTVNSPLESCVHSLELCYSVSEINIPVT